MTKLEIYSVKIEQLLSDYLKRFSRSEDDTLQLILDTNSGHYLLMDAGWFRQRREYNIYIHLHLKNQKIWVEHDTTEAGVANELVSMGVPKDDIVLGFHTPSMRQHSEFAVE